MTPCRHIRAPAPPPNRSAAAYDGFELVIGRLTGGRRLADVKAVIRRGTAARVPGWFATAAILPAQPGASPRWGLALRPGRYALVGVTDRTGSVRALAEITVHRA